MSEGAIGGRAALVAVLAGAILASLGGAGAAEVGKTRVWLDVDTAIGEPMRDVDDGLALIQAFHSPELEIAGASAVYGNAPLDRALPIAREVAARFGPEGLDVKKGAASAEDLGKPNDATAGMAEALEEGRATILALGPVTNVATLLRLRPDLATQIDAIVVVAGRRPGQRFLASETQEVPHRDFNFELDPEGMRVLLESDVPLVLAPWEVSSHVWLTTGDLNTLAIGGTESGMYVADKCRAWAAMWRARFGTDGFNPFDTLAIGWVAHPDRIEAMEVGVWIEEGPDDRATEAERAEGKTKPYLLVDPNRKDARRATYCFRPDPTFRDMLIERLRGRFEP